MPSEPVLVAMNGVPTSGWPGSPFNWRSFGSRSKPSFSIAISSEYSAGASWPFDEKYTSASSRPPFGSRRCSVHSQVMMSVELKLEPMWPEPACMIMNSVLMRHRSATSSARATGSVTPSRTARNTSRDTYDSESSPTNVRSEKSFSPI